MVASAKATGAYFNFKKGQKNLLVLSAKYIAGMMQIVRSIVFDLQLIVGPVSSNPLKEIDSLLIDFSAFVPMQVQAILADTKSQKIYESIPNVIIGGAPINLTLQTKLSTLKNQSYATFGMTETVSHVALKKIRINNTLFEALPNVSFEISEDDCLIVFAPHLLIDALTTNDIVRLIDQHHFEWIGRADYVINSGGVKIHPEELEQRIEPFIETSFYVSSQDDELLGQKLILYIEGLEYSANETSALIQLLKRNLNPYEVPKDIVFKRKFKRTATGKVIRV